MGHQRLPVWGARPIRRAAYDFSILSELVRSGAAICVCPECLGGLPVPRLPCEIAPDGRVYDRRGCDRTDVFRQGASRVLEICLRQDIRKAVFKEKSPSCGVRMRYDGSFTGRLIPGEGLAVRLLRRHGIAVYSEEDIPDLFGLSAAKG